MRGERIDSQQVPTCCLDNVGIELPRYGMEGTILYRGFLFLEEDSAEKESIKMNQTAESTQALQKKTRVNYKSTKVMVQIAMLSAIAIVLMLFEFPLPFAPSFYKLDFSELPVIIGAFAIGPVAGILIEAVKILLNFLVNGSTTAGVGEFANFIIGCAFVLPAALIYTKKKNKTSAIIGLVTGIIFMTVVGCFINAYVLLPAYATAFHWEISALIALGSAVNPAIQNLWTFILLAVAPFNLVKGILVSGVTLLIYKKISLILKGNL